MWAYMGDMGREWFCQRKEEIKKSGSGLRLEMKQQDSPLMSSDCLKNNWKERDEGNKDRYYSPLQKAQMEYFSEERTETKFKSSAEDRVSAWLLFWIGPTELIKRANGPRKEIYCLFEVAMSRHMPSDEYIKERLIPTFTKIVDALLELNNEYWISRCLREWPTICRKILEDKLSQKHRNRLLNDLFKTCKNCDDDLPGLTKCKYYRITKPDEVRIWEEHHIDGMPKISSRLERKQWRVEKS
jgi:hypothetical protein